jgi:hypothetical protein
LACGNGRLAFGFSGIAEVGGFRSDDWIVEKLSNYRGPNYDARTILEWLAAGATSEFASNPELQRLAPAGRRLSLLFTGYLGIGDQALIANALITNFQDADTRRDSNEAWAKFRTWFWIQKHDVSVPTHVQRIGAWPATTPDDADRLRTMLERDPPVQKVVGEGIGFIRSVADRLRAAGTVGKSISSVVIPRDGTSITAGFHPHEKLDVVCGVNHVVLLPESAVAFKGIVARRVSPTRDSQFIPKVGRNKLCPCGRAKKYKQCHGK